ncbi:MAG: O-antigen ligase family protein, partial [Syntrophomonadaceae bacterium]|nr:O-antigen ligase family protein [Syntrophomonadaceae bacterium]
MAIDEENTDMGKNGSYQLAFWGLILLLFFPPFFRGLFFPPEQQKALMLASIALWFIFLWKYSKRDYRLLSQPMDYFLLALPAVYLLAAFNAANYGLAVNEVVKNTLYFLVYFIVLQLVQEDSDLSKLLHTIYLAALGVSLAGLMTATGIVNIKDGFLWERIYSSFQYPNALASYLALAVFLGLFFWLKNGSLNLGSTIRDRNVLKLLPAWLLRVRPYGYLYGAANFLLLAVLFGTRSRGGLLVTGTIFLVYLAGLAAPKRLPVLAQALVAGGIGYLAVNRFIPAAAAGQVGYAWGWIFMGLAAMLLVQAAYNFLSFRLVKLRIGAITSNVAAFGLIAAALTGGAIFIYSNPIYWQKLQSFEFLRNALERFYFVNDAVEMIRDKPLLGWGGGGWKEAYRSYQNYLYDSNEVHSYYFQVGVETGLPGLAVVLGIWISFLWGTLRAYHKSSPDGERRALLWTLLAAAAAVGGHALIDFDLSLSALTISLWAVFAGARALWKLPEPLGDAVCLAPEAPAESSPDKKKQKKKISREEIKAEKKKRKEWVEPNPSWLISLSAACLIVFCLGLTLAVASSYAIAGQLSLEKGDLAQAQISLNKAVTFNPLNADYHSLLMQAYLYKKQPAPAIEEAQKAAGLSRYSASKKTDLALAYLSAGRYEEAVDYARQAVEAGFRALKWDPFGSAYMNLSREEFA